MPHKSLFNFCCWFSSCRSLISVSLSLPHSLFRSLSFLLSVFLFCFFFSVRVYKFRQKFKWLSSVSALGFLCGFPARVLQDRIDKGIVREVRMRMSRKIHKKMHPTTHRPSLSLYLFNTPRYYRKTLSCRLSMKAASSNRNWSNVRQVSQAKRSNLLIEGTERESFPNGGSVFKKGLPQLNER